MNIRRLLEVLDAGSFAEIALGFRPDAVQMRLLEGRRRRLILNAHRQNGKSSLTAAKALHAGLMKARSMTVVMSPTERQSAEFVRKASEMLAQLGMRVRGDGDNSISLLLPNGSRIVGLADVEGTIRGFSNVSLVVIDEASRVSDQAYKAVRPMLATSDGELWLLSTPHGKRGFFYNVWARGGPEWERVAVKATECPRIPPAFLEEERREMGDRWFRQEYLCEFVDAEDGVFDMELVMGAFRDDVKALEF